METALEEAEAVKALLAAEVEDLLQERDALVKDRDDLILLLERVQGLGPDGSLVSGIGVISGIDESAPTPRGAGR